MSPTKSSETELSDDVQIIREILFGDQAKNFQKRIEALEAKTSSLTEENRRLRKSLTDESEARQHALEASQESLKNLVTELSQQLKMVDQSLTKLVDELRSSTEARFQQTETARSSDMKEQNDLVVALLAALEGYKRHTASNSDGND